MGHSHPKRTQIRDYRALPDGQLRMQSLFKFGHTIPRHVS